MLPNLQQIILQKLVNDEKYCRKVLPFIRAEYFEGSHRSVYRIILDFIAKYNKLPTTTALNIEIDAAELSEDIYPNAVKIVESLKEDPKVEEQWLVENTEKWCKDRALFLAIVEASVIIEGKHKDKTAGSIPDILQKALAISFDNSVGHDYIDDSGGRFDFYHRVEDRLPFDLHKMNEITKGGVPKKTLNIILAGCVHPSTLIRVRLKKPNVIEELTIPIGSVEKLLSLGYEIDVESPDGFVPVSAFVDKGKWEEYILTTETGKTVRCNENHLFETTQGWVKAADMLGDSVVLTKDGYESAICVKTGKKIPIVDIQVEHENHRYYTEEISSHNTGVGKSLAMCHMAASYLSQGKNVLYITMEMAEERIAERIDSNLMNVAIDQLGNISRDMFDNKITKIAAATQGKLIIKEYPTASAHAGHFRALLNELKLKRDFTPDAIFIDYLNICASSRMKGVGNNVNTYSFIKAIAEEIRGLAVEFNVPIWSATQTTRSGYGNTDVEITDTSESFGLPATADLMIALISTEELEKLGQIMVKQLKNRYNDITKNKRFVIGVDRSKMKLFDVDERAQTLAKEPAPVKPGRTSVASFNDFKVE